MVEPTKDLRVLQYRCDCPCHRVPGVMHFVPCCSAPPYAEEPSIAAIATVFPVTEPDVSPALAQPRADSEPFQSRVGAWMQACFGPEISADKVERNHRFLEEALELVQACGCTREECLQLVDYVYGRPIGIPFQEVGGVRVTLAALCDANKISDDDAAETELARVWTKIEVIRAKQAAKPRGSVLPVSPSYAIAREAGE